ncbi:GntR family transcriptional regulator [Streptomyces griseocarneus]|nr:GntR family transcriptional regulator [Streptomyces griseocarneus]
MTAESAKRSDPNSRLARTPLGDQVRRILVDRLLKGYWKPGDRIVERRVAMELGVSQAPVREALRDLQRLQLVELSPNKGTWVRELTPRRLTQVYPVRGALERLAAELAPDRLVDHVDVLEGHTERMHAAAEEGDVDEQVRHGVAFHREIVEAAGNSVLLPNWESLTIELWTRLSLTRLRTELHDNASDHEPLVEAFRRRDPDAGRMLQLHILGYAPEPIGAP